ncbi:hypothetical protein GEMRC1_012880 [Eukaryota sp. GEM-RC1]
MSGDTKRQFILQLSVGSDYSAEWIDVILDEITANCCYSLSNYDKQEVLMGYTMHPSTQHKYGFSTNMRVLLADLTKDPEILESMDRCETFVNTLNSKLPMYEVRIPLEFQEWYFNRRPCCHVGNSDIFLLRSLSDIRDRNYDKLHVAVVNKFYRLHSRIPWSKVTVITQNPICPLTVLCAVKIGSICNYIRQISAMVDLKIPAQIKFQLGIELQKPMSECQKQFSPSSVFSKV